jgi:hypothetical protein
MHLPGARSSHTCNPSYPGDRDQEDLDSKPAQANRSARPYLKKKKKNPSQKRAGRCSIKGLEVIVPTPSHPLPHMSRIILKGCLRVTMNECHSKEQEQKKRLGGKVPWCRAGLDVQGPAFKPQNQKRKDTYTHTKEKAKERSSFL